MRSATSCLLLLVALLFANQAAGMFEWHETQNVPIARVFTNLQQRLAKNTNDFEVTYYLARLHAMAYSTNLAMVAIRTNDSLPQFDFPGSDAGVPRSTQAFATPQARELAINHLTNAIYLYQRALLLLRKSTNVAERSWMILPTQLGLAWCLDQAGRTNDALAMYRKTLQVAWKQEVTGDFSLKEWVNDIWRDVRSGRNPIHSHNRGGIGPGVCYACEIIDYMLRLLDPVNDASEIAQLKQDQKTLGSMGRSITPILVPLVSDAPFEELVDECASVAFDLDGSGHKSHWAWITPKAGWLVFDPHRTGRVSSGLQMFGNVTFWIFWSDGYEALSVLDDNGDGVLTGSELCGLAVWNDINCNGISESGEVVPVEILGVEAISCTSQAGPNGMRWNPEGICFSDGRVAPSYDWIAPGRTALPEKPINQRPSTFFPLFLKDSCFSPVKGLARKRPNK